MFFAHILILRPQSRVVFHGLGRGQLFSYRRTLDYRNKSGGGFAKGRNICAMESANCQMACKFGYVDFYFRESETGK